MPDSTYDEAVRALLKCPDIPSHAHISIEALRAMADDAFGPGVFREALQVAYDDGRGEGWEDGVSQGRATGYMEGYEAGNR